MHPPLAGISSKATAALLAELAARFRDLHGRPVALESVGGVDAARRVREGEAFDVVVLDAAAIDALVSAGCVLAEGRKDIVRSKVVVAVRAGAPLPSIESVERLQAVLLAAASIGFSTGPSGSALKKLIAAWGLQAELEPKLRQAPPGVPVGSLIAKGDVEIGFQQFSELMSVPGIAILGPLPAGAEIVSTFSAGICAKARDRDAARQFVEFLASPTVSDAKRRHGFEPA